MNNGYAIETHELTKKFGKFTAVDNVSFTIKNGEVFGFLGANGAGKSTTIRMLNGILRPTSGSATVAGSCHQKNYEVRGSFYTEGWGWEKSDTGW